MKPSFDMVNQHTDSDSDFMTEEEIKKNLKGIGKKRSPGKNRGRSRDIGKSDDVDPTPWIEPDHDIHQNPTQHVGHNHEFTYMHMEPVHKNQIYVKPGKVGSKRYHYSCDLLTDKWWEWFLKTPSSVNAFTNPGPYQDRLSKGVTNGFLFKDVDIKGEEIYVYFAAASAFQDNEVRTIVMNERAPLLVPVYNMSASEQDYPSLMQGVSEASKPKVLTDLILNDLRDVTHLSASFDGNIIEGCCVVRQKPFEITNIPKDNVHGIPEEKLQPPDHSIVTCHGGFWLLIRKEKLSSGDHLIRFSARSKNYEIAAKLFINVVA